MNYIIHRNASELFLTLYNCNAAFLASTSAFIASSKDVSFDSVIPLEDTFLRGSVPTVKTRERLISLIKSAT